MSSYKKKSVVVVGVSFISLLSKRIATLITESQSISSEISIILPVQSCVLKNLFEVISTGANVFDCVDDVFAVKKAAELG